MRYSESDIAAFTPLLSQIYQELKAKGKPFEIVFVSSDRDEASFTEYHHSMPWLAVPFQDRATKNALSQKFGVSGIPTLVLLDEEGKTITQNGRSLIYEEGADGFPYKPDPVKEAEKKKKLEEFIKSLPAEVNDSRHPHPLQLREKVYGGNYGTI
jgi:nucleoredoxin